MGVFGNQVIPARNCIAELSDMRRVALNKIQPPSGRYALAGRQDALAVAVAEERLVVGVARLEVIARGSARCRWQSLLLTPMPPEQAGLRSRGPNRCSRSPRDRSPCQLALEAVIRRPSARTSLPCVRPDPRQRRAAGVRFCALGHEVAPELGLDRALARRSVGHLALEHGLSVAVESCSRRRKRIVIRLHHAECALQTL